jgi:hypothetical protein
MKSSERWMLACGIVIADLLIIVVPVMAFVLAYVVVARPAWFKEWVEKIYA